MSALKSITPLNQSNMRNTDSPADDRNLLIFLIVLNMHILYPSVIQCRD